MSTLSREDTGVARSRGGRGTGTVRATRFLASVETLHRLTTNSSRRSSYGLHTYFGRQCRRGAGDRGEGVEDTLNGGALAMYIVFVLGLSIYSTPALVSPSGLVSGISPIKYGASTLCKPLGFISAALST